MQPRSLLFCLLNGLLALSLHSHANTQNQQSHSVVIVYHHDANHTPAVSTIHPETFAEHMAYLHKHKFNVQPLPDILNAMKSGKALPEFTIALTFDDGYTDTFTNAFPVLKQYGFPFTIFVNADKANEASRSKSHSSYATWDMLREMAKAGASIQNHTASHVHMAERLDKETIQQWKARIQQNIQRGHNRITQEIGTAPTLLAYPYGEYTNKAITLIKQQGYLAAFGMNSGAFDNDSDFFSLPRFAEGGHYVATHDFALRAKTKPMPLKKVHTSNGNAILEHHDSKPSMELIFKEGKYRMKELACYGMGQGKLKIERINNKHYKVTPHKPIPSGRSTYNCTMPGNDGRYHWYSHPFNRKLASGKIIHD